MKTNTVHYWQKSVAGRGSKIVLLWFTHTVVTHHLSINRVERGQGSRRGLGITKVTGS